MIQRDWTHSLLNCCDLISYVLHTHWKPDTKSFVMPSSIWIGQNGYCLKLTSWVVPIGKQKHFNSDNMTNSKGLILCYTTTDSTRSCFRAFKSYSPRISKNLHLTSVCRKTELYLNQSRTYLRKREGVCVCVCDCVFELWVYGPPLSGLKVKVWKGIFLSSAPRLLLCILQACVDSAHPPRSVCVCVCMCVCVCVCVCVTSPVQPFQLLRSPGTLLSCQECASERMWL